MQRASDILLGLRICAWQGSAQPRPIDNGVSRSLDRRGWGLKDWLLTEINRLAIIHTEENGRCSVTPVQLCVKTLVCASVWISELAWFRGDSRGASIKQCLQLSCNRRCLKRITFIDATVVREANFFDISDTYIG